MDDVEKLVRIGDKINRDKTLEYIMFTEGSSFHFKERVIKPVEITVEIDCFRLERSKFCGLDFFDIRQSFAWDLPYQIKKHVFGITITVCGELVTIIVFRRKSEKLYQPQSWFSSPGQKHFIDIEIHFFHVRNKLRNFFKKTSTTS